MSPIPHDGGTDYLAPKLIEQDEGSHAHSDRSEGAERCPISQSTEPGIVAKSSRVWVSVGIYRRSELPQTLCTNDNRSVDITHRQV